MDQYKDYRIHLWSFDTEVFNPKVFTPDNADELLDYNKEIEKAPASKGIQTGL